MKLTCWSRKCDNNWTDLINPNKSARDARKVLQDLQLLTLNRKRGNLLSCAVPHNRSYLHSETDTSKTSENRLGTPHHDDNFNIHDFRLWESAHFPQYYHWDWISLVSDFLQRHTNKSSKTKRLIYGYYNLGKYTINIIFFADINGHIQHFYINNGSHDSLYVKGVTHSERIITWFCDYSRLSGALLHL